MPILKETVRLALKEQAPQLYRQLERSGQLATFVKDQSRELNDLAGDAAMARIIKPEVQNLPYLEKVGMMNAIRAQEEEIVLAEMAFPSAEKSPPSPGETTASQVPMT